MKILKSILVLIMSLLMFSQSLHADAKKGLSFASVGNSEAAISKWQKSSKTGDAESTYYLGLFTFGGKGIQKNEKAGTKLIKSAADQGFAEAVIGKMYYVGDIVRQDFGEASKYFMLAATNGHAQSQHVLALLLEKGLGIEKNAREAAKFFKLASAQGHVESQVRLVTAYAGGEGLLEDFKRAHMWANIAKRNGAEHVISIPKILKKNMSPADVIESQDMARTCLASSYNNC